jgi:peroxiredoxin Q/BCP
MQGKPVKDFSLPSTGGATFRLSDARGTKLVLTRPLQFARASKRFSSRSSCLPDPVEAVCRQLGVLKSKTLYGKQVRGIERSTLVLDRAGVLAREWRGVKVPGHVQEVVNFAKAL